jgi:ribosomal protein S15P/S13E
MDYYKKYLKYKNKYFNLKYSFETAESNIKQAQSDLIKAKKLVNDLYIIASNKTDIVKNNRYDTRANNEHKQAIANYNKAVNESLRLEKLVHAYNRTLGNNTSSNSLYQENTSPNPYDNSLNRLINETIDFLIKDIPNTNRHIYNLNKCYQNPRLNQTIKNQIERQYEYYTVDLKEKQDIFTALNNQKNKIENTYTLNQLKIVSENLKNIDLQSVAHKNSLIQYCQM